MSTQEGATRPRDGEVGIASLANFGAETEKDDIRLKRHYLWNPFENINLVGPDGLKIRLGKGRNFYGQGIPGETYEDYINRGGNALRRCFLYPIENIRYNDTIYNVNPGSYSLEERERGKGNDLGKGAPTVERGMSAGVCSNDFERIWGESHGGRSLVPLIGMDEDTAAEIFRLVQPRPYKLTSPDEMDQETLFYDLTHTAPLRIAGAGLDAELRKIAEKTRALMRAGVMQGITTARNSWEELHKEMNNAKNSRPGKSTPTIYDEQVAFLLGEVLPASVARPRADMESNIMKALDRIGAAGTAPPSDIVEGQNLLAEIRAEREALRLEREALDKKKGPGK